MNKREYTRLWYHKNKERLLPGRRERRKELYRIKKSLGQLGKDIEREKKWYADNLNKVLFKAAKRRSRELNIPFNIVLADIIIPSVCPILDTPFQKNTSYAASIDKIIPELGYVKGNIQVISMKANQMKSNATPEELRKFANWALNQ